MTARRRAAAALLLFALAAAVYAPAVAFPFLSVDDPEYVTRNPAVLGGLTAKGAAWAFTSVSSGVWQPLAFLSHMADVSLFATDPRGPHAVNVLLHGANGALLFLFLAAATGRPGRSLAAAALFAVHPLHVESVAWVAERRDVLCAFLFLLALLSWLGYVRRGGAGRYGATAALFLLALLAKPMAVTFPVLLLLLDPWPLGRAGEGGVPFRSLVREKLPLLALAAAFACATLAAARSAGGVVIGYDELPLGARLANGALSYAAYLGKALWPARLSIVYPHPWDFPEHVSAAAVAASALLFAAAWGAAVALRRRAPWLLSGWGWFVAALLPVIGIVQAGIHGRADRYTYLPLMGIYWAAAWSVAEGAGRLAGEGRRREGRAAAAALGLLAVAALAWGTRGQLPYWESPRRLFARAAEVTERNYQALAFLGNELVRERDPGGAEAAFRRALEIYPEYSDAWGGLGRTFLLEGRPAEAEGALRRALALGSGKADDRRHLGESLRAQGRADEALPFLLEAERMDPLRR